jgi:hypothetical protein
MTYFGTFTRHSPNLAIYFFQRNNIYNDGI